MRLYKMNIYINIKFIFICFGIITLNIFLDSFIKYTVNKNDIYDLQFLYSNLNLYRQWIYISVCTVITFKNLSFTNNYLYTIRLGTKNKIWNLIIKYIIIDNFIVSLYLVTVSYIVALVFTNQNYMKFNETLVFLVGLILLYTVGLSMFNIMIFIIKIITGSENIAYLAIIAMLVPETLKAENSLVLYDISFNMDYLKNTILILFKIIKLGGITILLYYIGRFIYGKEDIYKLKK
ncbi:MAG: hypothetical protein E6538_02800 [Paeniclostridium sordellii]|nr:hypothetical protein [Paeniclostridium sordellii]